MALNFPGPYQIQIQYTVSTRLHRQSFNLDFGTAPELLDAFEDIFPLQRDGGNDLSLDDVLTNYLTAMANFFNTGAGIGLVELYSIAAESFDKTFISSKSYSVAGASGSGTQQASEAIMTLRTQEGGVMRCSWLDTIYTAAASLSYAGLSGNVLGMANFLISDDNVFLGRDTSYPISVIGWHQGQNEALFKKIYRS